ncbi:YheC/YheD family endospore coat-associated protein [Alkaliphilus peptidifermentans]|uniref:YheC/D like ATP-grasp n=1 Tax=Alkaliphilus peptidifermentans DSM 18978 TaxID=1120976 RepID=A0A1G5H329_9FIRM|nr:YheC/YheD family protein [Alkaliphilus peptidifermentans]SCY57760.1 YheC/D like ATP-grasp [Alkaliphilus peptidifermentans DSM 18978]
MAKKKRKSNLSKTRPTVGVLVRSISIKKLLKREEIPTLTELKDANKQMGLTLYVFSIKDVDLIKKRIKAIYFNDKKGLWEKGEFPYPDIIYKKNSSTSQKKSSRNFEKQLKNRKVKPLNYLQGFNKWEVYTHLSKENNFLQYLPITRIYKEPIDLLRMFEKSEKLYLKACRGGRGKQVMKVTKLPKGGYEYSYYIDKLYVYRVENFNILIDRIKKFYAKRTFLIQQAIDLITIDNKIVDLRAEVQRNANGKITVAAIPVRIGQYNAPITTHAECFTFDHFFNVIMNYSDDETKELKSKIEAFLRLAYESIEKYYGPSGEIGIDVGLDKSGKLWFIECNARSLKVSLHKAYDKKTINQSYLNLLKYAEFRYSHRV